MKKKKRLITLLKICFSLLGLYLAYRNLDLSEIRFAELSVGWFALALILQNIGVLISSLRLRQLAGKEYRIGEIMRLNYVSLFFNSFLPTNVGGDFYRAYAFGKRMNNSNRAASIILIDRVVGLAAMLGIGLLATAALLFGRVNIPSVIPVGLVLGTLAISALLGALYLFPERWIDNLLLLIPTFKQLRARVIALKQELMSFRSQSRRTLLMGLFLSSLFQINVCLIGFAISRFLNLDIPLYIFFCVMPFTNLILLLPISINGIGVRDYIASQIYPFFTTNPNFYLVAPSALVTLIFLAVIGAILFAFTDRHHVASVATKTGV